MTPAPTRRRFLAISAAACTLAGAPVTAAPPETRWRGTALGAAASVRIVGLAPGAATDILHAVETELLRLEDIFSLYRPGSALARLNRDGRLTLPPPDLLELLSLAGTIHHASGGAFDPSIQPLFAARLHAAAQGRPATRPEIARAARAVGWDAVRYGPGAVTLDRPGAALTLNGIAQGFITDRIAALLRSAGLTDVLVDAGEIAARGRRPDGTAWIAGIVAPDGARLRHLRLTDRALATSAVRGTMLDPVSGTGHILDPSGGNEATGATLVSISAPRAALADGLSTALCVVPGSRHRDILAAFPGARLEIAL